MNASPTLKTFDVCPRPLPLEGAPNVRDFGGYPAANGKTVKNGLVYRAGELYNLTPADLALLEKLGLAVIVDFRSHKEQEKHPDKVPATVRRNVDLAIDPGNLGELIKNASSHEAMVVLNHQIIRDAIPQYRAFFRLLADPANTPLLFHCTAGKDRVGVGSALFLAALGVSREIITQDYLFSGECVRELFRPLVDKMPGLAAALGVDKAFLDAAFAEMEALSGSVEGYLTGQLGVDLAHMRALYTA